MTPEDEKVVLAVAELWFKGDYSIVDIGQELSLPNDRVVVIVRVLGKVEAIIKKGMLERIQEALDLG